MKKRYVFLLSPSKMCSFFHTVFAFDLFDQSQPVLMFLFSPRTVHDLDWTWAKFKETGCQWLKWCLWSVWFFFLGNFSVMYWKSFVPVAKMGLSRMLNDACLSYRSGSVFLILIFSVLKNVCCVTLRNECNTWYVL